MDAKENGNSIIYHHQIIEAIQKGELIPEETDLAEIREFIQHVSKMHISETLERQFNLLEKKWGYLYYVPQMETWIFLGNEHQIPKTIAEATTIITTDAWLMPDKNGSRKGIQISGVDKTKRPLALMYDQNGGALIRADIGVLEEELTFDATLLGKIPQYSRYEMAGAITTAMISARVQQEATRIVKVRGRLPHDSARNLGVEGINNGVKIPDFGIITAPYNPDSYQLVMSAGRRKKPQPIATFPKNLAA